MALNFTAERVTLPPFENISRPRMSYSVLYERRFSSMDRLKDRSKELWDYKKKRDEEAARAKGHGREIHLPGIG